MTTNETQPSPYVFLSYASADREKALRVAELIEAQGISMWFDRKSIAGGTTWGEEIVRGIEECAALVVLCSAAALASPNVGQEIQLAWDHRRPILPLLLDQSSLPRAVEYALAGRQWVEVLERPDEDWLSDALRALRGVGVVPAGPPPRSKASAPSATPSPLESEPAPRHNLPAQLTSFIGREAELAEVKRLLHGTRLLTLTGTGGAGKTRLALRVGADLVESYREGVWLVDLAPLADPALVPNAVASAVGARGGPGQPIEAALLSYLRSRQLLIILDNCEHLIDACARLADTLLRGCPDVRILATSREALGITGEASWRVPSLALPPDDPTTSLEDLATVETVRLFVERATAVHPAFALTAQNAPLITQICRRLDGIPLAIELAAARVRALSVEQIAARLDQRFRLLTGGSRTALPRQQTLAAMVGWSYDLLTEPERTLFNRLSVFAGGLTLEAAEAVCGYSPLPPTGEECVGGGDLRPLPPEDVLDLLTSLVDKSLVVADAGDGTAERYRLLETLRQYGREKLVAAGEAEAIHCRHAANYRDLVLDTEPHLVRPEQLAYLARLDLERDNVRAALRWHLDAGEADEGLSLVDALYWYWWFRGLVPESFAWYSQFLRLPSAAPSSPARAGALASAGAIAALRGDVDEGRRMLVEALAVARDTGNDRTIAKAMLSASRWGGPDKERWYGADERGLAEGALARARAAGDRVTIVIALIHLGVLAYRRGDQEGALSFVTKGLTTARAQGDRRNIAFALEHHSRMIGAEHRQEAAADLNEALRLDRELVNLAGVASVENLLGRLAYVNGDYAEAGGHFRACLCIIKDWTWMERIIESLAGLAIVAGGQGQPERALSLGAAAVRLRAQAGTGILPDEQEELDRALASAREASDEAAAAVAEGEAMTLEQAIDYALEGDGG